MRVFEAKERCSGCSACMHICPVSAIEMKPDEEGFLYPEIDETSCICCGLCQKICPFNVDYEKEENLIEPLIYAAKHVEENVREGSTSGGVFTALSDYVLKNGGLVCGARFDENFKVCHAVAESIEERDSMRGSKYVQSELGDVFPEIKNALNAGRKVLFTGTPCQNAGLNAFLKGGRYPDLLLCDLVCHGTPSPIIWEAFVKLLEKKTNKKLVSFNFRNKSLGWHKIWAKAFFEDGLPASDTILVNAFNKIFFQHLALRPSCHACPYTNLVRPSDITIADFWGIEKHKPDFDDNKGVSLVLLNTQKGKMVFEKIQNDLVYQISSVEECLLPQVHLKEPASISPNREVFWDEFYTYGIEYVVHKYCYPSIILRIKTNLIKPFLKKLGIFNLIRSIVNKR